MCPILFGGLVVSLPGSSHSSVLAGMSNSPTPVLTLGIVGMESSDYSSCQVSLYCSAKQELDGTALVTELNLPRRRDTSRVVGVAS